MKRQSILKSVLCLLMALVCNVAWAAVTVPETGVYTIEGGGKANEGYRGFLAAGENYPNYPVLSNIRWSNYANNSTTPITNGEHWYVKSDGEGKFYIYNLGLNKFITKGTGTNIDFSDTPYAWQIVVNGSNDAYNSIRDNESTYLCFGCGRTAANRNVYFNSSESDGGSFHTFMAVSDGAETYAEKIQAVDNSLNRVEISYTLTDNARNTYTGTYQGIAGVTRPTIAGASYTLSNEAWNDTQFTATITFPFPVSSASVTNATMISSFKEGNGGAVFKWYAMEDNAHVKVQKNAAVTKENLKSYSWAIYPSFNNGAFVFSIKNVAANKYIYTEASYADQQGSHDNANTISLQDTPTEFMVSTDGKCRFYYVSASNRLKQYLSYGSTSTDNGYLGVYAKEHNGTTNSFYDATIALASKGDFVNGEIYTFVTVRGWMGAKDGNNNVISTAKSAHGLTGSYSDPMFQWTVYKSKDGYYFLYNLGKQQFMGVQSANNASIPFSAQPAGKNLAFKDNGQTTGYPIMFSTDNAGVANHSTSYGDGLITWTGGWNTLNDGGSNHKVSYVGKLSDEKAQAIADEVEFYLNNVTALDQLSNTATYKVYGERGFIYATEGGELKGTNKHSVDYDKEDPYHHFAILKVGDNYYLYNVGAKKFVIKNGSTASLSDTPARQTFTMGAASNLNTAYDWVIRLDGTLTHLSNAAGSGVYVNNGSEDEGTRWAIFKTGAFNPEDALFVINNYNRQLPIKAVVEGSWENNPNTHFGRVRATSSTGSITTKLNIDMDVVAIDYDGLNETTIDFTRDYRGFEFQGYSFGGVDLGKSFTLTAEQKASITEQNPLVAKFRATEDVTLFYDDDVKSYRIPAIGKTSTGRLIAVSDYRHNLDDIGMDRGSTGSHRIDLVIRTSDDNGKTWSPKQTIAEGTDVRNADDCAFGDAAVAVVGQKVLVMAAAGDVIFANGTADAHNRTWRVYSEDNGATWNKEDISEKLFIGADATIPNGYTAFFGSGKLAVDSVFVGTPAQPRIYGAMLIKNASGTYNNFVIYTDNFGADWKILGGSTSPIANQDEPKVEILPSGQILFSVRRGGGRQFNVFTYGTGENDKTNGVGTWNGNVNGCDNEGSNSTNGEIYLVDAKRPDGTAVKLLFQSQPVGGGTWDRENVSIWYKEINGAADYVHTSSEIASGWTKGMQVSHQLSAYSTMVLQNDGRIAFFFEEAPCYNDNYVRGYCMVYTPLTIDQITKGHYFAPNADLTTVRAIDVVLTDAQGNEYRDQVQSTFAGIAEALAGKYSFITVGDNANLSMENGVYTYTNTVTLPFKVSNEEEIWHNIYFMSNKINNVNYPVYLSASAANNEFVTTSKDGVAGNYGDNSWNTLENADKISWAVYNVNGGFTFKFKNKLTGKFIQVTSAATGNSKNVTYVDEANATAFELVPSSNNFYAVKAPVNGTDGYLCCTSASYGFATHYTGYNHAGGTMTFAEAPDFEALIAEANATLDMIGTGLGQYTASEANVAAAAAAKEAMKNSATVKLNTLNTYKTLTNGATLNLPVAGQYFRIRGISGNYIDATSLYNASTGQMSMKSAEACNYNGTIFYFDEENHLLNYATGTYTKQTSCIGAVGDTDKAVWTITESPRKGGKYALRNTVTSGQNGQYLHDSDGNRADRCGSNCGNRHDFTLEEVTALPVSISAKGYGTLYAPVALEIPEHVKAYTGAIEGDLLTLTKITSGIIPAGTGVVLYRDVDSYDVAPTGATAHNFVITTTTESVENNAFHGSVATIARTSVQGEAYTLQADTQSEIGVAFKPSATNVASGKAYLVLPSQESANMLRIRFAGEQGGTTTEIDNSQFAIDNSQLVIYDLQGRRVESPTKGMYIVGGKKVVIR